MGAWQATTSKFSKSIQLLRCSNDITMIFLYFYSFQIFKNLVSTIRPGTFSSSWLEKQINSKLNAKPDENEGFVVNSIENEVKNKGSEIQPTHDKSISTDIIEDEPEEFVPDIEPVNNEEEQDVKMEPLEDLSTFELMPC